MPGTTIPPSPQRSWVLPDEPVAVRLMNTVWADRTGVHDDLQRPADLRRWLRDVGAGGGGSIGPADLATARRLRDALRRLAAAATDDDRPHAATDQDQPTALDIVNQALAAAPTTERLRSTATGFQLDRQIAASPVATALAHVARDAADLLTEPDRRLRACYAPGCVLYFTKNHPRREWCSLACGNRARAARHYQRHRSD